LKQNKPMLTFVHCRQSFYMWSFKRSSQMKVKNS